MREECESTYFVSKLSEIKCLKYPYAVVTQDSTIFHPLPKAKLKLKIVTINATWTKLRINETRGTIPVIRTFQVLFCRSLRFYPIDSAP